MKRIFIYLIFVLLFVVSVSSFTPQDDIDLRNYYQIINGTNISATAFYQNDNLVFDDITDFTGNLTDTKYCVYDGISGKINCTSVGGDGDNASWNESYANTLYFPFTGGTITGDVNHSFNDVFDVNNSYFESIRSATGNSINVQPTSDVDDYFSFKTPANRPTIKREGGKFIYLESSNVYDMGLSLREDNTYSGTLNYEKDNHIMTMLGKNSPLGFKMNSDYDDYILFNTTVNESIEITNVVTNISSFRINAGGTNPLLFNHDGGNVGIGTDAPAQVLHMVGNGSATTGWARFGTSTTEYTEIGHQGTNSAINAVGDGSLDFRHDWDTKMSIFDNGNVSIIAGDLNVNGSIYGDIAGSQINYGTIAEARLPSSLYTIELNGSTIDTGTIADTYISSSSTWNNWNKTYADTLYAVLNYGDDWNKTYADTLYRAQLWDNFTGIPTSIPADGDTSNLSTANDIRDYVIGLNYFDSISDFTAAVTDTKYCIYDATLDKINCTYTPTGTGDITSVQGADKYIINGSDSGDVRLLINETELNSTIDDRDSDTTYTAGDGLTLTGTQFNVTPDGIGDTQLEYNTGQALTSASAVTFDNVTVSTQLTTETILFEGDTTNHKMYDNATCVILESDTVTQSWC